MTTNTGSHVCVESRHHRFALSSAGVVGLTHDTRDGSIPSLARVLGFTQSFLVSSLEHTRVLLIRTQGGVASVRVDRVLGLTDAAAGEILPMPDVFTRQARGLVGLVFVAAEPFLLVDVAYLGARLSLGEATSITAPAAGEEASP